MRFFGRLFGCPGRGLPARLTCGISRQKAPHMRDIPPSSRQSGTIRRKCGRNGRIRLMCGNTWAISCQKRRTWLVSCRIGAPAAGYPASAARKRAPNGKPKRILLFGCFWLSVAPTGSCPTEDEYLRAKAAPFQRLISESRRSRPDRPGKTPSSSSRGTEPPSARGANQPLISDSRWTRPAQRAHHPRPGAQEPKEPRFFGQQIAN